MPYEDVTLLPHEVRRVLPANAQEMYRLAYNIAWREYAEPFQRKGDNDHETTAQKFAWEIVQQAYECGNGGVWRKKVVS